MHSCFTYQKITTILIIMIQLGYSQLQTNTKFHYNTTFSLSSNLPNMVDFAITNNNIMMYHYYDNTSHNEGLYLFNDTNYNHIQQHILIYSNSINHIDNNIYNNNIHRKQYNNNNNAANNITTIKYTNDGFLYNTDTKLYTYFADENYISVHHKIGEQRMVGNMIVQQNFTYTPIIKYQSAGILKVDVKNMKYQYQNYPQTNKGYDTFIAYIVDLQNGKLALASQRQVGPINIVVVNKQILDDYSYFSVFTNKQLQSRLIGLSQYYDNNTQQSLIIIKLTNKMYITYYSKAGDSYKKHSQYYNPSTDLYYRNVNEAISLYEHQLILWKNMHSTVLQYSAEYHQQLSNKRVLAVASDKNRGYDTVLIDVDKQQLYWQLINEQYQHLMVKTCKIKDIASCVARGTIQNGYNFNDYLFFQIRNCQKAKIKNNICHIKYSDCSIKCISDFNIYNTNNQQYVSQQNYTSYAVVINDRILTIPQFVSINKNIKSNNESLSYLYKVWLFDLDGAVADQLKFQLSQQISQFKILYNKQWKEKFFIFARPKSKQDDEDDCYAIQFGLTGSKFDKIQKIQIWSSFSFWRSVTVGPFLATMKINNTRQYQYLTIYRMQNFATHQYTYQFAFGFEDYYLQSQNSYLLVHHYVKTGALSNSTDFYNLQQSQSNWYQNRLYTGQLTDSYDLQYKTLPTNMIIPYKNIWIVYNFNQTKKQSISLSATKIVYNISSFPIVKRNVQLQNKIYFNSDSLTAYFRSVDNADCFAYFQGSSLNIMKVYGFSQQNVQKEIVNYQTQSKSKIMNDQSQKPQYILLTQTNQYIIGVLSKQQKQGQKIYNLKIKQLSEYDNPYDIVNQYHPLFSNSVNILPNGTLVINNFQYTLFSRLDYWQSSNQYGFNKILRVQPTKSGCLAVLGLITQNPKDGYKVIVNTKKMSKKIQQSFTVTYMQQITQFKLSQDCQILALYIQQLKSVKIWNISSKFQINSIKQQELNKTAPLNFGSLSSDGHPQFIYIQGQSYILICSIFQNRSSCNYQNVFRNQHWFYNTYGNYLATFDNKEGYLTIYQLKLLSESGSHQKVNNKNVKVQAMLQYAGSLTYSGIFRQNITNMYFKADNKLNVRSLPNNMSIFDPSPCPATFIIFGMICYCDINFTRHDTYCQCPAQFVYFPQSNQCKCPSTFNYTKDYERDKPYSCECQLGSFIRQINQFNKQCIKCSKFCTTCIEQGINNCLKYSKDFYFMVIGIAFTLVIVTGFIIAVILITRRRDRSRSQSLIVSLKTQQSRPSRNSIINDQTIARKQKLLIQTDQSYQQNRGQMADEIKQSLLDG